MDVTQKHTRRTALKTGLVAATATALAVSEAKAQQSQVPSTWEPKKPGEIRISAICGEDNVVKSGLNSVTRNLSNANFWWADNYSPITREMLNDTDLLITYYSTYLYTEENAKIIIDNVTSGRMGWIALHNTPWFTKGNLSDLLGVDCALHREIQPVIISNLNQNHPITKGIEPHVINLDEQFGLFLRKPNDPDVTVLFKSQGVHDKQWTIQGVCAQRGKGRVVSFAPGHYNWTFKNEACQEILWRSANWVLNLPIPTFYGNYDNFIW